MPIREENLPGAKMGLSGLNVALMCGLTDAQIVAATGVTSLRTTIEGLVDSQSSTPEAKRQASLGIQWGANAGVLTDANIVSATGATDLRNLFVAELGDISPFFTGQLPQ